MKHKIIKKVLMCKPLHFDEIKDTYNPWMQPGAINKQESLKQWENLAQSYIDLDIKLEIIDSQKSLPDMVFSTDQGIVQDKKVLLSNFRPSQRQGESKFYEQWFSDHGYTIFRLPKDLYFEGNGDCYFWNNIVFIGGYRNQYGNNGSGKKVAKFLEKYFDRKIIPLNITDPAFFHLDVGFFPLNHETIFYYPPAFSEKSQKTLQKLVPNLIEFTKEEAFGFCGNSVTTDHHVIMQKNNPTFADTLKHLGYTPVDVDLGEFKKSGGGAHCLTNILESV